MSDLLERLRADVADALEDDSRADALRVLALVAAPELGDGARGYVLGALDEADRNDPVLVAVVNDALGKPEPVTPSGPAVLNPGAPGTQCIATASSGHRCRNRSTSDGKCHAHGGAPASAVAPLKPPSVAVQLVNLALAGYTFVRSTTNVPYAVPNGHPKIARPLHGRGGIGPELSRELWKASQTIASDSAVREAVRVLEGFTQEAEPATIHQRVGRFGSELWLDLANEKGEAVRIDRFGWHVTDDVPILFRRTNLTNPLPRPAADVGWTGVGELFRFINVPQDDKPLILADLIAALDPDIPHPVVCTTGPQGAAKTTGTSILVSLIDPSAALTRKAPRDPEEWVTAAAGSWRVALDNVGRGGLPDWLSDALCRASTGTGDVRRTLYHDEDVTVIAFRRSCLINGISLGRLSMDLIDRALPIALEPIADRDRKDDQVIWDEWREAHPRILGALLDLAVAVLAQRAEDDTLAHRPRMIDFARYLNALDGVAGTNGLERYVELRGKLANAALDNDSFIDVLERWVRVDRQGVAERVKAGEILKGVNLRAQADGVLLGNTRRPDDWPRTPQGVGVKLAYDKPALEKRGWIVAEEYDSDSKSNRWTLQIPAKVD